MKELLSLLSEGTIRLVLDEAERRGMCGPLKVPSKRAQENMRIVAVNTSQSRGDSAEFAIASLLNWMIAENGPNTREVPELPKKLTRAEATAYAVQLCVERGWSGLQNGAFPKGYAGESIVMGIERAQGGFDE